MRLLLSESLPLRTTRMLGDFADDRVLSHRLGDLRDTRFHLVKLSDTEWFAADHEMQITAVQIDDETTASWQQEIRGDAAGMVWTVVVLGAPAPPNASVTASGLGKRDRRTGRVIENPADIMEYVLRLAGRSETFPSLRAECAAAGLAGAGSLDVVKSIRGWLDEIAYSFGAIWIPSAARLYPTRAVQGPVLPLNRGNAEQLAMEASLEDTCDVLRVSYNLDQATDRAQKYVELSTRPHRFGGVPSEVVLRWLRKPDNAESVGTRMLQRMAGSHQVNITTSDTQMRPCQWRRFEGHPEWPRPEVDPVVMVLAVSVAPDQGASEATLEFVSEPPAIVVTAHSVAVPPGAGAGVDVEITGGEATFGVTDDKGRAMPDALVSLDGGAPKRTNAQGKVSFTIVPADPPNRHLLAVEAPGYTPFTLDVYL